MTKIIAYTKQEPKLKLVIEEDKNVGFYLIVYPEYKEESIADYLYDCLEDALADAEESYKIPRSAWKEAEKMVSF